MMVRLRAVVLLLVCIVCICPASAPRTRMPEVVTIGVFGLFHPRELKITAIEGSALVLQADSERMVLERSSGDSSATIAFAHGSITISDGNRTIRARQLSVSGRQGKVVAFELSVPGKIRRRYRGTLTISPSESELLAVVAVPLEDAVASVVAAESSSDAPIEALKAQAVATRSYFVAALGRHRDFGFCDTTHCQFLREVPLAGSDAAKAAEATQGLVLAYESRPFAAMYTRSCSGQTHTPAEVKLPSGTYPYFPVECAYCRTHPVKWQKRISARDVAMLQALNEPLRLRFARRRGWDSVPSNDFVMKREGESVLLEGVGQGHGIGLCQAGAKAMAKAGADFREILAHYYPNTSVKNY